MAFPFPLGNAGAAAGTVQLTGCRPPPHQVTPETSREKSHLVRQPVRPWAGVTDGGEVGFTPLKPVTLELPRGLAAPDPQGADQTGAPGSGGRWSRRGNTGSHGVTPELE